MPEQLPVTTFSGLLEECYGAFAHIPGMVKTISRLVIGSGEAGAAWIDIIKAKGEKRAQAERDEIKARSSLLEAITPVASTTAIKDDDLVKRAIESWAGKRLREQINKEAVARETVKILSEDPPEPSSPGPTADWMNFFENYAEKASSDDLRAILGRALAGEIRSRGSFSLRTLQFITILDHKLALRLEKIAGFIVNHDAIPGLEYFARSPGYDIITELSGVGLLAQSSVLYLDFPPKLEIALPIAKNYMAIVPPSDEKRSVEIKGSTLTPFGTEVFALLDANADQILFDQFERLKTMLGGTAELRKIR